MDLATEVQLKCSEQQNDKKIAHNLSAALCKNDAEEFLRLYDDIPADVSDERVSNYFWRIKFEFRVHEFSPRRRLNL